MKNATMSDRRLWLTEDRSRLVPEGDPAAAFLWVAEGQPFDADEAARLGYPAEPKKSGQVACDVDGCSYEGTKRGLKIHVGQVHGD